LNLSEQKIDPSSLRDRRLDGVPVLDDLAHIVPVDVLQHTQDSLSSALGMPVIFVSPDGKPITSAGSMDSFCWQVTKHGDAQQPCAECNRLEGAPKFECPMGIRDVIVPIEAGDLIVGYLVASQATKEKLEEAAPALATFAHIISKLATDEREVTLCRINDPLTGLANRAHFWECLTKELDTADYYNYPVSVLLIDLDEFKTINCTYGHETGDRVLRTIGEILKKEIRATDLAARYSSDSFLVLLRFADPSGAEIVAWRLKNRISELKVTAHGQLVPISASAGIVTYPTTCAAREPDDIFRQVHAALRQEKSCPLRVAS
jgi:diguanylate cyclase (GGDEF)-like protein